MACPPPSAHRPLRRCHRRERRRTALRAMARRQRRTVYSGSPTPAGRLAMGLRRPIARHRRTTLNRPAAACQRRLRRMVRTMPLQTASICRKARRIRSVLPESRKPAWRFQRRARPRAGWPAARITRLALVQRASPTPTCRLAQRAPLSLRPRPLAAGVAIAQAPASCRNGMPRRAPAGLLTINRRRARRRR